MASFFSAALRLAFKRKPQEGRIDEEQGVQTAPPAAGLGSAAVASTSEANSTIPHHGARSYLVPEDDSLTLFRLMVGISTSPYLGYSESSPIGTRPAANIGIYSRVIHSEQKSKDSFKVFSILINGCYFLQIVVAASLTAMGAAGVSHGAVTAFGAINTIIAGLLTFLKGSGLPGRLKYYGNEWKKIREFIEQRERDFSRAGCTLDVFEVVATIDKMYNTTKREIEMNTPDSYTSLTGNMHFKDGSSERVGGHEVSKLESRLKGLDGTVQKLAAGLEGKAREVADRIHEHEKSAVGEVEHHASSLDREARTHHAQAMHAVDEGKRQILDEKGRISQVGSQALTDVEETHRTAMHKVTDRLGHHHDSRHEEH
ncbi:hypothetical protein GGR54DRAFT_632081 [Hypoxylon sp. NC1633]|nr:hypothetical protein GGR54DRAFT_632081 [Hypoxylon sp. NC1633]